MFMARLVVSLAASAALLAPWGAQAQLKPLTQQQERMKSCNAEASGKQMKGEERQAFMSRCLKGEAGGKELTAQQQKMVTCNRTAGDRKLKGNERRAFMSDCLSAKKDNGRSAATGR